MSARAILSSSILLLGACTSAPTADAGSDDAGADVGSDAYVVPLDAGPPLGLPPLDCSRANCWRFAVLSDTHVIDQWYVGPENGALDTESILMANARLMATQGHLNAIASMDGIDLGILAGDVVHQWSSADPAFYTTDPTAGMAGIAIAHDLLAGFSFPIHVALGNHDYHYPEMPRETTASLFRTVFGVEPYYAFEHRGLRFLMLNSQLGDTWLEGSPVYDTGTGSLGADQLAWLESELADGRPSVVVVHHQPLVFAHAEVPSAPRADLFAILDAYRDTIRLFISGHMHRWWNYGTTYGPRSITMGSTRYDENAFLVFRADETTGDIELVNGETPVWRDWRANAYTGP
jgi:3',5'-cyclic AMP phosphodiesterase CpdA